MFGRGLRVLPVVAAAQIVASLGIGLGLVAFIVPGVFLYARWGVVAQAAAVDRVDWRNALRRSAELTAGSLWHVLGVLFTVGLFNALLDRGVGALVAASATGVQVLGGIAVETITLSVGALTGAMLTSPTGLQVLGGIAVETITLSVGALTGAMLFFDLRARQATRQPLT